ncbi:hypothetical protein [Myxococcus xanthus]|nr:hypothetical protein [Myxococcus xanthus]
MNAMKRMLPCCVAMLTAPWAASAQVVAKESFDCPPKRSGP